MKITEKIQTFTVIEMYAGTVLLLCLYFTEQFEIGGLSSFNTTDTDLLAILLDLHLQHCGDAVICDETDDSHIEPPPSTTFPQPCCIPCSCLPTCEAEQNCCPSVNSLPQPSSQSSIAGEHKVDDAYVTTNKPLIDEQKSGPTNRIETEISKDNVKSISGGLSPANEMEQNVVTPTYTFDTTRTESADAKPNSNNIVIGCVRPQMLYKLNVMPDSDAFEMIISCPQTVDDTRVAEKCRNGNSNENIADIVPVTSKLSGLTYVNKYCLFCNEQKSSTSGEEWKIQIIDENFDYLHRIYNQPQSLMNKDVEWYFNVHFVPNDPKSVKKCILYDVNTCNHTGYWETYDVMIHNICHNGPGLPVIGEVNRIDVSFKNIACLICNLPPDAHNHRKLYCNYFDRPKGHERKTLTVNFNTLVENENPEKNKFGVTYIQNSLPQNLDFRSCPQGFAIILVSFIYHI